MAVTGLDRHDDLDQSHASTQLCLAENPRLLHYGLDMEILDREGQITVYQWDKAAHHGFDALACPPWNVTEQPARRGLFPHPPLASTIVGRVLLSPRACIVTTA